MRNALSHLLPFSASFFRNFDRGLLINQNQNCVTTTATKYRLVDEATKSAKDENVAHRMDANDGELLLLLHDGVLPKQPRNATCTLVFTDDNKRT